MGVKCWPFHYLPPWQSRIFFLPSLYSRCSLLLHLHKEDGAMESQGPGNPDHWLIISSASSTLEICHWQLPFPGKTGIHVPSSALSVEQGIQVHSGFTPMPPAAITTSPETIYCHTAMLASILLIIRQNSQGPSKLCLHDAVCGLCATGSETCMEIEELGLFHTKMSFYVSGWGHPLAPGESCFPWDPEATKTTALPGLLLSAWQSSSLPVSEHIIEAQPSPKPWEGIPKELRGSPSEVYQPGINDTSSP